MSTNTFCITKSLQHQNSHVITNTVDSNFTPMHPKAKSLNLRAAYLNLFPEQLSLNH